MNMSPVVHFEMPYEDRARMTNFYSKVFGWVVKELGPEMGDYAIVDTAERDPITNFPKEPGRINGGFFKKAESNPHPSIVIAVKDINQSAKDVTAAGGTLLAPGVPVEIPGTGLYLGFTDPEGNRVSMIQPNPM